VKNQQYAALVRWHSGRSSWLACRLGSWEAGKPGGWEAQGTRLTAHGARENIDGEKWGSWEVGILQVSFVS